MRLTHLIAPVLLMLGCCACALQTENYTATRAAIWEPEISAFEKHDIQSPPPASPYLFIGSSSFRFWKDLETTFGPKPVMNRGFGGSEIRDSTHYIDRIVVPYRPRMVTLYAGDNDINSGRSADQVFNDFKQFVEEVRTKLPDVKIGFVSIKPSPSRWKYIETIKDANKRIRNYMRKQKRMVYIDIFTPTLGEDGNPRPEFFKEDKLHPSDAAYMMWRKVVAPYLK